MILLGSSRHPWAVPARMIIAGQSNAGFVRDMTPQPRTPYGVELYPDSARVSDLCVGGSALFTDWAPGTTLRANLVNAAQTAPGPVVVLWVQGESDQDAGRSSAQYQSDFDALRADVVLGRGDVLWFMPMLSQNTKYGPNCVIRQAQETIVRRYQQIERIETDGYTIQIGGVGDDLGVHYTSESCQRCWATVLTSVKNR